MKSLKAVVLAMALAALGACSAMSSEIAFDADYPSKEVVSAAGAPLKSGTGVEITQRNWGALSQYHPDAQPQGGGDGGGSK